MTRHDPDGVRRRILSATIDALAQLGHAATTTLEVQRRAQVSRGTLQHHYPSRLALLTATVEEIGARRHAEVASAVVRRNDTRPLDESLRELRRRFSTPTYYAELELWVAARCDPALRAAVLPIEKRLGREMSELLASDFDGLPEGIRTDALRVSVDVMRGIASTDGLRSTQAANQIERQLKPLLNLLEHLEQPTSHEQGALR